MPDHLSWNELVRPDGIVVEPLGSGIFRFSELALIQQERSNFYLVQGAERSCLIDGGWGLCSDLHDHFPAGTTTLVAVGTHSHYDHIGYLNIAKHRLGHRAEAHIFREPGVVATQAWPFLVDRPCLAGGGCIDVETIKQNSCPLTGFLDDGEEVDLGGRVLHVLHTPGHSPGSISLFDDLSGTLFCGDILLEGDIYDDIPGADRKALLGSHQRLASLPFSQVLSGHGQTMDRARALDRIERYRESATAG